MRTKDEAKEQMILDSALSMIAKVGLSGFKITNLAKEVGIAAGTIYIYFKDKEALIKKLYLYLIEKEAAASLALMQTHEPLKNQLEQLCYYYLANTLQNPEHAAFFEQYTRSPYYESDEELQRQEALVLAPIYHQLLKGQQANIIKPIDPEVLVTLICGALAEYARLMMLKKVKPSSNEWAAIFQILWDGIKC
ncbi:TetR/AcrR family transcriptional regulator [Flectobacillus major]|jgi:AcrR family transcriptional regulator|uniref:TetR/AcrR family transcriptional regulator n=1 Tax=Flectobacillus major TaxID=103 RepID=UPI0004039B8E|nr:TetR/AcrR family transcriptional regulator [Flectobacillus major]